LNLQSAKTEILTAENARAKIEGVDLAIVALQQQLTAELRGFGGAVGPYATVADLERFVAEHPDAPAPPVLEKTFRDHFTSSSAIPFDKTLFHYLLTRLGKARSQIAVAYCLGVLRERPEETESCLRYFEQVALTTVESGKILEYIASDEAIYDYQIYQVLRWFFEARSHDPDLLSLCRRWAFDRNRPLCVRSYALAILGAAADPADLERIQESYSEASREIERADVVAAMTRMEVRRRNGFYGSIRDDGDLVKRAINRARSAPRPTVLTFPGPRSWKPGAPSI
jgi:hypothetical protein